MRVLLTTDTIGGVWTFTRELASELLHRGHAVALVSLGRSPSSSQQAWADTTAQAFAGTFTFTASDLPLEWMPENALAYAGAADLLSTSIDRFAPDLLHFNQFCFGAFPIAAPKLVTAHSDVLSWAAVCRPEALKPSLWLHRYIDLVKAGLSRADAVVAPTCWAAAALRTHFPFGPEPQVILNGRSLPDVEGATERVMQAVSAGRLWDEAKNTALLTRIDSPVPILIAGDNQLGAERAILAPDRVSLVGLLSEADLLDLFGRSSLYVATSIYEPFGLAPLEAALCGCAVLANDIPSLHEVWGDAALYFHDGPSLEDLLLRLTAHPMLVEAAQHRSFARARELTASRMADAYLLLYKQMIAQQMIAQARPFAPEDCVARVH